MDGLRRILRVRASGSPTVVSVDERQVLKFQEEFAITIGAIGTRNDVGLPARRAAIRPAPQRSASFRILPLVFFVLDHQSGVEPGSLLSGRAKMIMSKHRPQRPVAAG